MGVPAEMSDGPSLDALSSRIRRETPGAGAALHLNAASSGLPPDAVTRTVVAHVEREAAIGADRAAHEAGDRLAAARTSAAALLGCRDANIAFGPSAGRLWALAFGSLPRRRGSRVLIAPTEWTSNVVNLLRLERDGGLTIDVLPSCPETGLIDVDRSAAAIDERTIAVCLPLVASGSGVRQPAEDLARIPRPHGALMFVDASQAVGGRTVDMSSLGADVLVAPSRKWLRGPRGDAVMALSDGALTRLGAPPVLDHAGAPWTGPRAFRTRDDARRFETFEFSVAGRLGLGAALDAALDYGVDGIEAIIAARLALLAGGLAALPGLRVFEDAGHAPAFITFLHDAVTPRDLQHRLAARGITIGVVERAYAQIDFAARGLSAVARVAPHAYSDEADLERFLDALRQAIG